MVPVRDIGKSVYENPDDKGPPALKLLGASELFGTPRPAATWVWEYMCPKRGFCVHWLPLTLAILRIRIHMMTASTMTITAKTPPITPPISAPRDTDLDCPLLPESTPDVWDGAFGEDVEIPPDAPKVIVSVAAVPPPFNVDVGVEGADI